MTVGRDLPVGNDPTAEVKHLCACVRGLLRSVTKVLFVFALIVSLLFVRALFGFAFQPVSALANLMPRTMPHTLIRTLLTDDLFGEMFWLLGLPLQPFFVAIFGALIAFAGAGRGLLLLQGMRTVVRTAASNGGSADARRPQGARARSLAWAYADKVAFLS